LEEKGKGEGEEAAAPEQDEDLDAAQQAAMAEQGEL
jgi:hypothetical protein